VIVHVLPEQLKAGKRVLCPMELPWVLDTAPRRENRMFPVFPEGTETVTV
jgi:hypothetical protein